MTYEKAKEIVCNRDSDEYTEEEKGLALTYLILYKRQEQTASLLHQIHKENMFQQDQGERGSVLELFQHFVIYFDKIIYIDENKNIEEMIVIKDNCGNINYNAYDNFLEEYQNYFVKGWRYDSRGNVISISI